MDHFRGKRLIVLGPQNASGCPVYSQSISEVCCMIRAPCGVLGIQNSKLVSISNIGAKIASKGLKESVKRGQQVSYHISSFASQHIGKKIDIDTTNDFKQMEKKKAIKILLCTLRQKAITGLSFSSYKCTSPVGLRTHAYDLTFIMSL